MNELAQNTPVNPTNGADSGDWQAQNCSSEEVVKLIQRLYQPSHPQEIKTIQAIIYKLQRSPQGWQYADTFLQSQDPNVRFHGALTFTTKIGTDWDSVSPTDAPLIQERLIYWLLRLNDAGDSPMVLRKVCAALVAYYLRPSVAWNRPIRHLVICFNHEQSVSSNMEQAPTSDLASKLKGRQLRTLLWFMTGLVEEVGKMNPESINAHHYHQRICSNTDDTVALLQYSMAVSLGGHLMMPSEAPEGLKAFHAWVVYAHRAWTDTAQELEPLRCLTPLALQSLDHPNVSEAAMEFFMENLNAFPAFFTEANLESLSAVLTGEGAQSALSTLKGGNFDDEETYAFARLLLAYGEATVENIARGVESASMNQITLQLLDLLRCKGYAEIEDTICSEAVAFWQIYVEYLTDTLFQLAGNPEPAWMKGARQRLLEVIEACWHKICMPTYQEYLNFGLDAWKEFRTFRTGARELLQSAYMLLGVDLLAKFTNLALRSLANRAWLQLEATLFSINSISEQVGEGERVDQILSELFRSTLFEDVGNAVEDIPVHTRQTTMKTIMNNAAFFERNTTFLAPMMNFLFRSLRVPTLANTASKAILETCSSCRKPLVPELGIFLQQYELLVAEDEIDVFNKEKVIGAIATIIQAMSTDEMRFPPLSMLMRYIETDVDDWMRFMNTSQIEEATNSGLCALRCLLSVGNALETPDGIAIDLDKESPRGSSFWSQGQGATVQQFITRFLAQITSAMEVNGDVIETSCQILRAGYKELEPGPFVFPLEISVRFILSTTLRTARLDYVLDTARAMLSKQSISSEAQLQGAAHLCLNHLIQLIMAMKGDPAVEPEVASSVIDLVERMVPRFLIPMMSIKEIPKIFDFMLVSLASAEIMPKQSAAHFWATFAQRYDVSDQGVHFVHSTLRRYGPQLCQVLVREIAGEASRSHLDVLADPLKKLVVARPQARQWLSEALSSESFPSHKVGPEERKVWLQKIVYLRGAKATNQAIKDFWIACRGTEFAYAS